MTREAFLTPGKILQAAEEVLRKFGPEKATVVDVARALGVTHGSVYRHFPSKAALRDAVVARWLESLLVPLSRIADGTEAAPARLRRWVETLAAAKQGGMRREPELFATYFRLADEAREVVAHHVAAMLGQLARIVADGVAEGSFRAVDPQASARAVLDATARFHHPAHAASWADPVFGPGPFDDVWDLVERGLKA